MTINLILLDVNLSSFWSNVLSLVAVEGIRYRGTERFSRNGAGKREEIALNYLVYTVLQQSKLE